MRVSTMAALAHAAASLLGMQSVLLPSEKEFEFLILIWPVASFRRHIRRRYTQFHGSSLSLTLQFSSLTARRQRSETRGCPLASIIHTRETSARPGAPFTVRAHLGLAR